MNDATTAMNDATTAMKTTTANTVVKVMIAVETMISVKAMIAMETMTAVKAMIVVETMIAVKAMIAVEMIIGITKNNQVQKDQATMVQMIGTAKKANLTVREGLGLPRHLITNLSMMGQKKENQRKISVEANKKNRKPSKNISRFFC